MRAQRRARALPAGVTADDEIRALRRLDLQPRLRPATVLVAALLALADHAFEATGERRGAERNAVLMRVHQLHQRRRQQALRKVAPAIGIRRLAQIDAREMEQVEAEEDHGQRLVGRGDLALRLQSCAILQRRERRLAVRVERDELAVQDHPVHRLLRELRHQAREFATKGRGRAASAA